MSDHLIKQGLERFAVGDVAGATRLWLAARAEAPDHPQLQGYLEHVRTAQPELFAQLETEAAAIAVAERAAEAAAVEASDPWGSEDAVVAAGGPGLAVVDTAAPPARRRRSALGPLVARLRELVSLDNFTAALEVAEQVLQQDPTHAEARQAASRCRTRLATMYESKLGDLTAVPVVRAAPGEIIWLDLDHRAGFVLAQVDGASTFEDIIELTGMDRVEAMRILCDLLAKRAIAVEPA